MKVAHEQGVNGLVNKTSTGKLFMVLPYLTIQGGVPVSKSRTIWADANGRFATSAEEYNSYFAGSKLEGKIVRFDDIPEYEVEGKKFTHVNLLVLEGETETSVLASFLRTQALRASAIAANANTNDVTANA